MRPEVKSRGGMKGGMKNTKRNQCQKRDLDRELDDLEKRIVDIIRCDGKSTYSGLAQKCECSIPTIQRRIGVLQKMGVLRRVGPDRGGHWEVVAP